jgi:hypothetical protein
MRDRVDARVRRGRRCCETRAEPHASAPGRPHRSSNRRRRERVRGEQGGPITGYQIQPQVPATSIDTEVFALDRTTKQVVPTDSFSCQGDIPSYGINCVGTYGGNYEVVSAQFSIDPKLCAEPRVDPLLTVMYATRTATGVTQAIAGPFDLGRPRGCPKSAQNGKWRIPQEKDQSPD